MQNWKPKPGDRLVRHPRLSEIAPVYIHLPRRVVSLRGPTSPMALVYGFMLLCILGGFMLLLPISNSIGGFTPVKDAFFTSVSATTITGLVSVDSGTAWSGFGKVVILLLIFAGGLGFTTGAAFLILISRQRIRLHNRLIVREGIGGENIGSLSDQVRRVVFITLSAQTLGFIFLFFDFFVFGPLWSGIRWYEALWHALFHSVSAFNNAGFEILPDENVGGSGMSGLYGAYFTIILTTILILAGGLSHVVISDLWYKRKFSNLHLNSKLVIVGSGVLLVLGTVVFLIAGWSNPDTLGDRSVVSKITSSLFESVNTRSGGFSTIDQSLSGNGHTTLSMVLMFIGGASTSTAGGIKVNTFMIILFAVLTALRGGRRVRVFRRDIPSPNVQRAMAVGAIACFLVAFFVFLITLVQPDMNFVSVVFEVISAFGTVGLSHGATPHLNTAASIIIILLMFLGRLGPLTIAILMIRREKPENYHLAEERVRIG